MKKLFALSAYHIPTEIFDKNRIRGVVGQDITIISNDYSSFIYESGATPFITPIINNKQWINDIVERSDALILSGGEDLDPSFYNEKKSKYTQEIIIERDIFEFKLIESFLNANKAIFGICRGFQVLNVFFKGTLYQDYREINNFLKIHSENPYKKLVHDVTLENHFKEIYNTDILKVNSHHHQFIKKLGDDLLITAKSNDGMIEGFHHKKHKVFALQWHPEMIYKENPIQKNIINYLINIS